MLHIFVSVWLILMWRVLMFGMIIQCMGESRNTQSRVWMFVDNLKLFTCYVYWNKFASYHTYFLGNN